MNIILETIKNTIIKDIDDRAEKEPFDPKTGRILEKLLKAGTLEQVLKATHEYYTADDDILVPIYERIFRKLTN